MKAKWKKSPLELVEHFQTSTAKLSNIEHRKMFGYPCCFVNGNMFTGLHQESWIVRLGPKEQRKILDSYEICVFEPMAGRPMKQYVELPKDILNDDILLQKWLRESLAYVSNLPKKEKKVSENPKDGPT